MSDHDGLDRDLAELEASDPVVAEAAARLTETTAAIVAGSTSAQLRQARRERDEEAASAKGWRRLACDTAVQLTSTQTALAASQADLTRVERRLSAELSAERDKVAELAALYESACNETTRVERERDELRDELAKAMGAWTLASNSRTFNRARRLEAEAELASARAELDRWRAGAQPNTEGAPA